MTGEKGLSHLNIHVGFENRVIALLMQHCALYMKIRNNIFEWLSKFCLYQVHLPMQTLAKIVLYKIVPYFL